MKKYISLCLILTYSLFAAHLNAQSGTGVGINTENVHNEAVLSIQNTSEQEDDVTRSRAMKFPRVADKTKLQQYDASKSDPANGIYSYTANAEIEGMITYVENPGDFYYFNGQTWMTLFSKGKAGMTRAEANTEWHENFVFVFGISGGVTPNFSILKQDDLGITGTTAHTCDTIGAEITNCNGNKCDTIYDTRCSDIREFVIAESGMYDVTLGLKMDATLLLSLSDNVEMEIAGWVNGSQRYSQYINIGAFIEIGKITTSNASFTMFLRAGERVRFSVRFPWKQIVGGGGNPSGSMDILGGPDTYVIFRRVF